MREDLIDNILWVILLLCPLFTAKKMAFNYFKTNLIEQI